jgi:hypothetical protein
MSEDLIPAEVIPVNDKTYDAARAMAKLGFRILHIGKTISVSAPKKTWESLFGISFEFTTKRRSAESGGKISYWRPPEEDVPIPDDLKSSVSQVAFMPPPDLLL